jgi:hypothetical protein
MREPIWADASEPAQHAAHNSLHLCCGSVPGFSPLPSLHLLVSHHTTLSASLLPTILLEPDRSTHRKRLSARLRLQ